MYIKEYQNKSYKENPSLLVRSLRADVIGVKALFKAYVDEIAEDLENLRPEDVYWEQDALWEMIDKKLTELALDFLDAIEFMEKNFDKRKK